MGRGSVLLLVLFVGCTLDEVSLEGKRCPCTPGWFCVDGFCRETPAEDAGQPADASHDAGRDGGRVAPMDGSFDGGDDGGALADGDTMADGGGDPYEAVVLADAPLAYWRFDESAASTVAIDATGNGNDGSYLGGITLEAPGVIGANGAARFDGTSGRVVLGDRFDFAGMAPFTFEVWIQPELLDETHRRILDKAAFPPSGRQGYTVFVRAAGTEMGAPRSTVALERWRDQMLLGAPVTALAIPTDRFTHLVVTYDGARARIFLDGVQVADEASGTSLLDHGDPFVLGSQSNQSLSFYSGVMDEAAVYDHALSPARIAAHHAAGAAE